MCFFHFQNAAKIHFLVDSPNSSHFLTETHRSRQKSKTMYCMQDLSINVHASHVLVHALQEVLWIIDIIHRYAANLIHYNYLTNWQLPIEQNEKHTFDNSLIVHQHQTSLAIFRCMRLELNLSKYGWELYYYSFYSHCTYLIMHTSVCYKINMPSQILYEIWAHNDVRRAHPLLTMYTRWCVWASVHVWP